MPATIFEAISTLISRSYTTVNVYPQDFSTVSNTHVARQRTMEDLCDLYQKLIEVRIIEDYIADAIVKIPVKIKRGDKEIMNSNDLSRLKEKANPTQDLREVLKEVLVYYGLTGNGMLYAHNGYIFVPPVYELEVELAREKDLPEWLNYIYRYIQWTGGQHFVLDEEKIFHLKTAQLKSRMGAWVWGSSPYDAASDALDALEIAYDARIGMLQDRGALGIISNKSQIPDKEATKEVQDALSNYGMGRGKKKFIATPEDLSYQQMSLNAEELKLLDQQNADFGKLCMVRGIDPGVFIAGDSTYANQYAAVESTYRRAIIPTTKRFYEKLRKFTEAHFNGLYFDPELTYMPEMSDTQTKQSVKVVNEVNGNLLSREQGLKILYPELPFEGDKDLKAIARAEGAGMDHMGRNNPNFGQSNGTGGGGGRSSLGGQTSTLSPNGAERTQGGGRQLNN